MTHEPPDPVLDAESYTHGLERPAPPREHDHVHWFREHYDDAANQIIDFFGGDGITLEGKNVVDIGCGDGLIALGVCHKSQPSLLAGYDVAEPNIEALTRMAEAMEVAPLPSRETFRLERSGDTHIPVDDDSFDYAFSWSVFEHVARPVEMFEEIRRILRPDGVLFLQVWPLYFSEHGGHLWLNYREGFSHLLRDEPEIERDLRFRPGTYPGMVALEEYRSLNRLTIDDLQRAMLAGGLVIKKFELLTGAVHLPPELALRPLSSLGIAGVKLLAVPRFK